MYKIFELSMNEMAKIVLPKRSGKRSKVREKSLKSQGMLKRILSGNPALINIALDLGLEILALRFSYLYQNSTRCGVRNAGFKIKLP